MSKKSFKDIAKELSEENSRRFMLKVPEWRSISGLKAPDSIAVQQCSSSATALYKAGVAASLAPAGGSIADLTGGAGVDTWALSGVFSRVLYNDVDTSRMETARANLSLLGRDNVGFLSMEVSATNAALWKSVRDFAPDVIYLDPSRRNSLGRKVFLLEECSPDLVSLLPVLLDIAPDVIVKLSPMADISMLFGRIGKPLCAVHIVESESECKELLCIIRRPRPGISLPGAITVAAGCNVLNFAAKWDYASPDYVSDPIATVGRTLFVPSAGLSKSGLYNVVSARWHLALAGKDAHCYILEGPVPGELAPFGKSYRIREVMPFSSSTIREAGKRCPQCEVTAKGLPLSSENLRRRMKVSPGQDCHVFALGMMSGRYFLVTSGL